MSARRTSAIGHADVGRGGSLAMAGQRDDHLTDDAAGQPTLEELREFMEGDLLDVPARPEFKERLRRKLWAIVRARAVKPDPDRGPHSR